MLSSIDSDNLHVHFLLCMERTGSSMFSMMLNRNNDILSPSEEPFALYFYNHYRNKTVWTESEIDLFIRRFERLAERNIMIVFTPLDKLREKMISKKNHLDFHSLVRLIYSLFLPSLNKDQFSMIVDKQIKYSYFPKKIQKIFPHSKFIILVRDYRAVAASLKKRKKFSVSYSSKIWLLTYKPLFTLAQQYPEKYLIVHYEDLVISTQKTLIKVCQFLHVDFTNDMLDHHVIPHAETLPQKILALLKQDYVKKIKDFHSNTLSPVNVALVNEWENYLTPEEIKKCDSITSGFAQTIGYNKVSKTDRFCLTDYYHQIKAYWDRKTYLSIYVKTPLRIKCVIKRFRPNLNSQIKTVLTNNK